MNEGLVALVAAAAALGGVALGGWLDWGREAAAAKRERERARAGYLAAAFRDHLLFLYGIPELTTRWFIEDVGVYERRQKIAEQLDRARVDVQLFGTKDVERLMDEAFEAVQAMSREFAEQAQDQPPEGDYLSNLKDAFDREAVPAIRALAEAMRGHVTPQRRWLR